MNQFNDSSNVDLLWDVLLDENYVKKMNETEKLKLKELFHNHRNIFYEKEKNNNYNLVTFNKKFLTFFIQVINSFINNNNNNDNDNQSKTKVKSNSIYKIEDIMEYRKNEFEKELSEKKTDFENFNTLNKPPPVDFSEKIEDTKIKGMEELIAKTIAQRNYEISQIQNQIQNPNDNNSIQNKDININNNNNGILKQIKIKEPLPIKHDVINLKNDNNEKKISWNDTNEIKIFNKDDILLDTNTNNNNEQNENILNKLKKISINSNDNETNETNATNETNVTNATMELIKKMHKFNVSIKEEVNEYKEKVILLEKKMEIINNKLDSILKNKFSK